MMRTAPFYRTSIANLGDRMSSLGSRSPPHVGFVVIGTPEVTIFCVMEDPAMLEPPITKKRA